MSNSSEDVISRPISLSSSTFFLPSPSDCAKRLCGFRAKPRFHELRALAFLANQPPSLDAIEAERDEAHQQQIPPVRPPRAVPGRQNGEGIGRFFATLPCDASGTDAKAVLAKSQVRIVAPRLARPLRPVVVEPVEPRLVLCGRFVEEGRSRELETQRVAGCRELRRRTYNGGPSEEALRMIGCDLPDQRGERGGCIRCRGRIEANQLASAQRHPGDAVSLGIQVYGLRAGTEPGERRPIHRPGPVCLLSH